MKTADLKQTSIVATLDSALPDHKNAIWCATLQLAWNKLKDDIIHEPIRVIGVEQLANRLNQSRTSTNDLQAESFYADVGLVDDGIIQRIQREMAKRFPSEPKPVFSEEYRALKPTIVAYSYLCVSVPFTHPFCNRPIPFRFNQSDGGRVETTSFCAPNGSFDSVRERIDVLDYDSRGGPDSAEFVVDLCKDTSPYQIVLALISRPNSLGEGVATVEQRMSRFNQRADFDVVRKLQREDTVIVPDIMYKLQHHFGELEGKSLGNPGFEDYFLFEVVQMMDFGLSRTGLVLKSEVRFGTTRAGRVERNVPRYFNFDRPFLVYVKKRAAESYPFFVMWVDNAELMKKWPSSETPH